MQKTSSLNFTRLFLLLLLPLALLLAAGCRTRPAAATPPPATERPAAASAPAVAESAPVSASGPSRPVAAERPARWARPLNRPGLPNLHQVNDVLYRSAQPTAEGYAAAAKLGIKAVLRLRTTDNKDELDKLAGGSGLVIHDAPLEAWDIDDDDIIRALRLLRHARRDGPVLVHCLHGADRTGLVCAVYRILFENWTREDAIAELTLGGFGFHPLFANIPHYLRTFEAEKIKAAVMAGP